MEEKSEIRVWVRWFERTWWSYRPEFLKYLKGPGVADIKDAEVWVKGRKINIRLEG